MSGFFDGDTPDLPATTVARGWDYEWVGDPQTSASVAYVTAPIPPPGPAPVKYPPTVKIAGEPVPCDWAGTLPIVLDGIEIVWGRDHVWDPTEPGSAVITFLDPDGSWASDPGLYQAPITIETDLGVMFRGQIDQIDVSYVEFDGTPSYAWETKITAIDQIGVMAKITGPGVPHTRTEPYETIWIGTYGPGSWEVEDAYDRLDAVNTQLERAGVTTRIVAPDYTGMCPPGVVAANYFAMAPQANGDDYYTVTLQAITRSNTVPASVNYDPDTDQITAFYGNAPASLVLRLQDGQIVAVGGGVGTDPDPITIPCDQVVMDTPAVSMRVVNNITSVKIPLGTQTNPQIRVNYNGADNYYPQLVTQWSDVENPIGDTPRGRFNQLEIIGRLTAQGTRDADYDQSPADWVAEMTPGILDLNGRFAAPGLELRIQDHDYGADVEAVLLTPYQQARSFVFPGALFEPLTGWGPVFQLIGGLLRFEQGWSLAGVFAPGFTDTTRPGVAINELVTTADTPTFDQYAPNVLLSTLGLVADGIHD